MRSKANFRIGNGLAPAAIMGSAASLSALFELGAPRWTTPINILSVLCVVRMRSISDEALLELVVFTPLLYRTFQ